jgi:hypothetical protein
VAGDRFVNIGRRALPLSIFLLLHLCLPACRPTSSTLETVTPSPSLSASRTPAARLPTPTSLTLTKTPKPVATLQPQSTQPPTPTTEPTPTPLALQAPTVNGITFEFDPTLGDTVYADTLSMGVVSYTRFAFAPDGDCREVGCVRVYPVQEYEEAFPNRPLPPLGAATILRAQTQPLGFQDGAGTRSIKMYGQNVFWANNADIVYEYQGFTDDEQHYVLVTLPIDASILLSTSDPKENANEGAIPVPSPLPDDFSQLDTTIHEYNQEVERQLDLLAAADFTPSLDMLDALVTSLRIESPTGTSGPGSFSMVALIPPELLGEVTELRADPDGTLWVFATYGYALLRDGHWTVQPSERGQILIGVDNTRRMWFFIEEDGSKIYAWGDGPKYTLADVGWLPVLNPAGLEGRGVLTDANGWVWLVTDRDVRAFDGAEWMVFSPADMDMTPPPDADIATLFTLELLGEPGQIWVGECDSGGPGPVGGAGARWFDGRAWQGTDSPVASGCVTAIQEDSLGRVWVGVDADLWRYAPAIDDWTRFAPPQPPEGHHFRCVTEIALDPAGEPWPLFPVCDGASCGGGKVRYRLQDGAWTQIGGISHAVPETLVFDGAGTPWLVGGGVYRVEANRQVEPPVALLAVQAVTVDADGRVWVAGWQVGIIGVQPATDVALWVLEPPDTSTD